MNMETFGIDGYTIILISLRGLIMNSLSDIAANKLLTKKLVFTKFRILDKIFLFPGISS